MVSRSIIDTLKKTHILELLKDGKRLDGRSLEQPRDCLLYTSDAADE